MGRILDKYRATGQLKLWLPLCDGTYNDYSDFHNDGIPAGGAMLVREGLSLDAA